MATYNEDTLVMDSDGNLTTIPLNGEKLNATYDSRNRLTSVGDTTYRYDMENTRISKTENSKETRFTYNTNDHLSQLIMETDSSGNPTAYYIYGVGLVSKINVESNSSGQLEENTYYYHFDRRGSTVAITDLEGSIVNSYKYDIYGEILEEIEEIDNSLQYNGQYGVYTDDNGLYYMRSRYYNPEIKRFINRDVIVGSVHESQSLNRFAYVNGNPISFIDPFGLERETDTKKKVTWTQILDGTQLVLSVVGFIPVLGEIADIVNALISLGRGDVAGALLDIASAIPGAGNIVAAGRVAVKAGKVATDAGKVVDVCKSFGVGTLVLTKEGLVPIEDVQLGDYVLAKDVKTGDIAYKEVITLFERVAEEGSFIITVEGEEIVATPNHPFWVEGKGWLRADELTIDDFFVDEEGIKLDIISIEIDLNSLVVYNFEVEDYHTYFVGNSNVFTHNKNSKLCGKTGSGGAYSSLPSKAGSEKHHMPAKSVSNFKIGKGPSVHVDAEDHKKTASYGNSKSAQEYKAKQKKLIDSGKFKEAQQMDIDELRSKFPNKYEVGIKEMEEYTDWLLKENNPKHKK